MDTIVYGVIPRNFGPHGFRSVAERLDDLRDLGVNALWLSPINATPPDNFGYAVIDYFELRPDYGTKEEFKSLVDEARARGIRVLMDFVPNHSSAQHPYFLDAQERGTDSPYYDFYDRDANGEPTHYFHWTHLPNLNYDNPEAQQWMLRALLYWVEEFDVDGYRLDAVWGMRQRNPDLWPRWSAELKQRKPEILLIAEAGARDPYYFTHGFDAAYDWTDELGHWAWEHVFEEEHEIVQRLHAALTNDGRGFHPDAVIFRFLNNNDTGPRFITRYGEGMTRVATALLLTLPGIPCIFTGDEVGAEFEPYKHATPIEWKDRRDLRAYHQKLIALRLVTPSLHSLNWRRIEVETPQQIYAYVRYGNVADQPALVVLNFSGETVDIQVDVPQEFQNLAPGGALTDKLSDEQMVYRASEGLHISMPGWSARVLMSTEE